MRTLSYLLHPPMLDEVGLTPAIRWYVDGTTQRSGLEIDLKVPQEKNANGLGVGILGMRERMQQLGSSLEINSSRRGTVVRAIAPVGNSRNACVDAGGGAE